MKSLAKFLLLILSLFFQNKLNAQNEGNLSQMLDSISVELSNKLNLDKPINIGVWDFSDFKSTDENEKSVFGKYIAEILSIKLDNHKKNYYLIDRQSLNARMKEFNLADKGIIDDSTAKKLKKVISLDALATGKFRILEDRIILTVKILDTETSKFLVSCQRTILTDFETKEYMLENKNSGLTGTEKKEPWLKTDLYHIDVDIPVSAPKPVEPAPCLSGTGDLVVTNNTNGNASFYMDKDPNTSSWGGYIYKIDIGPGQTESLFELQPKVYDVYIITQNPMGRFNKQIKIEPCKKGSFTIR